MVLVPGALALLPQYASLEDPLAELRAACRGAVGRLGRDVEVAAGPQGRRIAEHLLEVPRSDDAPSLLVVGNGSATRTEKAPGHFDPRAEAFDDALGHALATGDTVALGTIDQALAGELWADAEPLAALASISSLGMAEALYAQAPYGVQYWVMAWRPGHRSRALLRAVGPDA